MTDTASKINLVLLPGMDGTGILFEPLLAQLSDRFHVSVIDYPRDQCLSYMELVEFVRAKLPAEPFALLVESFSGPIGYRQAQDRTVAMTQIIFSASFVTNPNKKLLSVANLLPLSILFKIPPPRWLIRTCCFSGKATGTIEAKEFSLFDRSMCEMTAKLLVHRLRLMSSLSTPDLPLAKPCLILNALDDRLVSARASRTLQACCVDAEQVDLRAPHFLLQSKPKLAADRILHFLE